MGIKFLYRNGWKWAGMFSSTGHKWSFDIFSINLTEFEDFPGISLYFNIMNQGIVVTFIVNKK